MGEDTGGAVRVSVCTVTYHSAFDLLRKTLDGLDRALGHARERGMDIRMQVVVVDNSTEAGYRRRVSDLVESGNGWRFDSVECRHPGGNIGYGAAHNAALQLVDSEYHLILNPDVEMDPDALHRALEYMGSRPDVAVVSPSARDSEGQAQYLCKRYPSVLVLSLRAFAPRFLREWCRAYLHSYEIRDNCSGEGAAGVPLVSGCCICARTDALHTVEGFSSRFFMYFEDFDLSLRLHRVGRLVHLPAMRIVHHGGHSVRKGFRHVAMFVRSGWTFFRRHGWCWI